MPFLLTPCDQCPIPATRTLPPLGAPRGRQARLNWRVQNDPFWSTSIGAAEVEALQTARKYALTCVNVIAIGCFGSHSAQTFRN
jgi:hypothetical protein